MPHTMTRPVPHSPAAPREQPAPVLLHEFFDRSARRWPNNVAIDAPPCAAWPERRTITYAELARRVDSLAARLREAVTGESVVAILMPRNSEHVYLAQLAVMKAGAAYMCIEPTFPDAQVADILGDSRPVALLTDPAGLERAGRVGGAPAWAADIVGPGGSPGPGGPSSAIRHQRAAPTGGPPVATTALHRGKSLTRHRPRCLITQHRGDCHHAERRPHPLPQLPGR
jgi:non-ribosomal peptide synthetase component F